MRNIKLTGREAAVVRAVGFGDGLGGAEVLDRTRMESEDLTDTLNSLISAGFIESTPHRDTVEMRDMPFLIFAINAAYAHELKAALKPTN